MKTLVIHSHLMRTVGCGTYSCLAAGTCGYSWSLNSGGSWGSVVGGFGSWQGQEIFLFTSVQVQPHIQWVRGLLLWA